VRLSGASYMRAPSAGADSSSGENPRCRGRLISASWRLLGVPRRNFMAEAARRSAPPAAAVEAGPKDCRRCDLWKHATQAVEGEGSPRAKIMLVGEQPGDEEDIQGHPFVGPAGRILDRAIAAAGLTRKQLFITNAVKHFKWEPRGKRRLHKKPNAAEINACHVWLEQEIATVTPAVIVALGATALRALTGTTLSIESARRQELRHPGGARILPSYHPSAILRAEGERAEELRTYLENDLREAAHFASHESR
jgi:uracil-DNA glycosylase family protein